MAGRDPPPKLNETNHEMPYGQPTLKIYIYIYIQNLNTMSMSIGVQYSDPHNIIFIIKIKRNFNTQRNNNNYN